MTKIKELRLENNWTQKELAEKINLDAHNIGDWERGKAEPSIYWLKLLSEVFNCSIDYLVGRENDFGIIQQTNNALTENENQIIALYRKLNVHDQHKVLGFIQALAY
ncbi:MAG: helix-turn-helix transcriptional regulator [Clostridia bacterium]|nr:helix-turn-helix transcriptional regulator [Clostridia bacterium]